VRGSLTRLGVEQIDLFQLHRVDPEVPADEQFGLLRALREEARYARSASPRWASTRSKRRSGSCRSSACRTSKPRSPGRRRRRGLRRAAPDRLHPVVPTGQREPPPGPARPLDVVAQELGATVSQVCLAGSSAFPCHGPHTRDIVGRASRGELRRAGITLTDTQYDELSDARKSCGVGRWEPERTCTMRADLVIRNGTVVDGTGARRVGPTSPSKADGSWPSVMTSPRASRAQCRRATRDPGLRRSPHALRRPGHVDPLLAPRRIMG